MTPNCMKSSVMKLERWPDGNQLAGWATNRERQRSSHVQDLAILIVRFVDPEDDEHSTQTIRVRKDSVQVSIAPGMGQTRSRRCPLNSQQNAETVENFEPEDFATRACMPFHSSRLSSLGPETNRDVTGKEAHLTVLSRGSKPS